MPLAKTSKKKKKKKKKKEKEKEKKGRLIWTPPTVPKQN